MQHRKRLQFVADQCPLIARSLQHTKWYGEMVAQKQPVTWTADGYTVTVFESRFFSWYRSFTTQEPRPISGKTGIILHEWVPAIHQTHPRWIAFGLPVTRAIATLQPNFERSWGSQARRHLKTFQKADVTLRLGTVTDVTCLYATSQVPKSLHGPFLELLQKHINAHAKDIDILVAEVHQQPIACLVAGNCDELGESEYLIGAFHPSFARHQPMDGLMHWWFTRSLERGYKTVNLGLIDPPPRRFSRITGYSLFKTHFDIARLWFPGNLWRVYWSQQHSSAPSLSSPSG